MSRLVEDCLCCGKYTSGNPARIRTPFGYVCNAACNADYFGLLPEVEETDSADVVLEKATARMDAINEKAK